MTVEAKPLLDESLELPDSVIELAWFEEARTRAGKLESGEIEAQDGAAAVAALETKLRQVHAR